MTVGEKIYELRKGRKMSQERVAELLGVSRQAVSKWETGQSYPTMENLSSLSQLFKVTIEELTNPDTKVELVYDLKKEIHKLKESSKRFKVLILAGLLLFIGTFIAALYTRFNGYDGAIYPAVFTMETRFVAASVVLRKTTLVREIFISSKNVSYESL